MEIDSSPKRKRQHKGGRILRHEPSDCNQINSYPFIKQCFEDVHCLEFCKRVSEAGFYEQLTDWVATHLKGETIIISSIDFSFSMASITLATGLPDNGEYWFKEMSLDLENYNPFLKTLYRDTHTHFMPFRYLLEKYAPLMKTIMRFFTYEGDSQGCMPIIFASSCTSHLKIHSTCAITYPGVFQKFLTRYS